MHVSDADQPALCTCSLDTFCKGTATPMDGDVALQGWSEDDTAPHRPMISRSSRPLDELSHRRPDPALCALAPAQGPPQAVRGLSLAATTYLSGVLSYKDKELYAQRGPVPSRVGRTEEQERG